MLKVLAPAAFLALTLQVCAPAESQAQTPEPSPSNFKVDASLRSRYELVDWFGPYTADRRYGFGHTKAQAGISYNAAPFRFYLQGQHFQLYDLPSSAAGPGAAYFVSHNSESEPGSAAFRQGYAEYKNQGYELYAGRFLYSNGMEVAPMNTALATLRAKRIAQRVIGPFDFTAGRSFDGARAAAGGVSGTLHTFFVMPTEGGFDSDLNQTIDEIKLAGLSWTAPFSSEADTLQDLQLFTYFYSDGRSVVKTDNREAATRTADTADIELITLGAHYITLLRRGEYPIDALLWGAGQFGDWGEQDHAALAFTAEIGASMAEAALRPGLRIGFTYGSGDSDPNDGDHGTFFQMLPTARAYAATPFYNMQNTSDLFVQLSAQPAKGVTLRTELHQLWLSDSSDLFYSGAGANERRDRFGYTGTPSGGSNDIGTLLDLEVSWIATRYLTLTAYYGHLFGDNVVAAAAQGGDDDIDYFFLEVLLLFS